MNTFLKSLLVQQGPDDSSKGLFVVIESLTAQIFLSASKCQLDGDSIQKIKNHKEKIS